MTTRHFPLRLRRSAALTVTGAAAVLLLAACGSDGATEPSHHDMGAMHSTPSASAPAATHNDQDVAFALAMIPHHQQAVAMAGLAATRARSQAVKDLAVTIERAQDPEITAMSGWLAGWGRSVPSAGASATDGTAGGNGTGGTSGTGGMEGMDGMGGMDHSAGSMPGMMSDAEMGRLAKSSGAAFDSAFLRMMISHHQGAIAMARTEQSKGSYGPARQLAASIIGSQSTEIARMNQLLGR
ncbi:DUF305 domain-containing protein [Streptomyces sp. NBC_01476]|uniref:DUF305 domain-containing protein n=1 Tax=Streptomyces sp. NBC_01476 TaxID=2903881 RepID=UPI002E321D34|nr:DUF305 domain-containing protein [Streptomyces sp. NBC_01476]